MSERVYQLQFRSTDPDARVFGFDWEGVGGATEWWTEEEYEARDFEAWLDPDDGDVEFRIVPWTAGEPIAVGGTP